MEREAELDAIARAVEHAAAGRGGLLVLEGPAGAGKSALLAAARELAEAEGFTVLRARAGQFERDFAFGVVRQLLEPMLGREPVQPEGDQFAVLNTLYWQVADLAEQAPLLVSVDDLHWCDAPSLRFVAFLAHRLEGVPILLAVGVRRGEPDADEAVLAELRADPFATVIEPAPLSLEGVGALLGDDGAAPEFRAALHRSSAGNPLLLRELLHAVAAERIATDAAGAQRIAAIGPDPVGRFVSQRLKRLGAPAEALARALAVLGEDADLDLAAALAELDAHDAAAAADALARMDVLEAGGSLAFVHPVVRESVYAGMPLTDREDAHRRAAALLRERSAPSQRVAGHLVHVAAGTDGAVEILRDAARRAEADGAPDAAAAYLGRALAEPMDDAQRGELLLALGMAERRATLPEALPHLRDAHALGADAALELANALYIDGDRPAAAAILEEAIERTPDRAESHRLQAELIFQAWYDADRAPAERSRLLALADEIDDDTSGGAYLLALLASDEMRRGQDREAARAYARRALARPVGHEDHFPYFLALGVLIDLDELDEALVISDEWLAYARRTGSIFAFSFASSWRSRVHLRKGAQLAEAEADARAGVEAVEASAMPGGYPFPFGYLADVLIERGDLDGALRMLEVPISRPASYQAMIRFYLRGRARLAGGDAQGGLDDLLDVGQRAERFGIGNPAELPWRSVAAECLVELGDRDRAESLATEELERARRWGAPREIGVALRALGLATNDLDVLGEAVQTLADSPAQLEHARTLADLGAALRRANRRAQAREPLAQALDVATRAGAGPLAARAQEELLATGARPRRVTRTGVDALTPSELRVARMAAEGRTNREIAQALFVTQKTVEMHLSAAYRKLDLTARSQLAGALAG